MTSHANKLISSASKRANKLVSRTDKGMSRTDKLRLAWIGCLLALVGAFSLLPSVAGAHGDPPAAPVAPVSSDPVGLPGVSLIDPAMAAPSELSRERIAALTATVPQAELDRLRDDLVTIMSAFYSYSPKISGRVSAAGLTVEKFQSLTDAQLTVYYNAMSSPATLANAAARIRERHVPTGGTFPGSPSGGTKSGSSSGAPRSPASGAMVPLYGTPIPLLPYPISTPDYGEDLCVAPRGEQHPIQTVFDLKVSLAVLKPIAAVVQATCNAYAEVFAEWTNVELCVPAGIGNYANATLEGTLDIMEFCDSRVDFADTDSTWFDSIAIHDNLDVHHMQASTAYIQIQQFLSDFQTLTVRMNIEENLQLFGDQRIGLFQLPAVRGGYLETVRDIVTDTLARNLSAGMPVGNTATLLADANNLYAQRLYKDAYARYREAYRAAVGVPQPGQ